MKRLFWATVVMLCAANAGRAQVVDATVCDVLAKPASFDGKTVRVKGTVIAGIDEFAIRDKGCSAAVNGIWLEYPTGTKGKAGPLFTVQMQPAKNGPPGSATATAVKLEKSKEWKQFDSALSASVKNAGSCPGCVKNVVTATLVGRLDGTEKTGASHDGEKVSSVHGFGSLNAYSARLVLESVSDVSAQEIDYSKTPLANAGGDIGGEANGLPKGSEAQKMFTRAIEAYGAPGEDNGVNIGFGGGNETHDWNTQAAKSSPDGVVYQCTFDGDRAKGDSMGKGLAFTGSQIADLRDAAIWSEGPRQMEYRAWQTAVLNAIAFHQKALIAPGGYVMWDVSWPAADRNALMEKGIKAYLDEWSVYSK